MINNFKNMLKLRKFDLGGGLLPFLPFRFITLTYQFCLLIESTQYPKIQCKINRSVPLISLVWTIRKLQQTSKLIFVTVLIHLNGIKYWLESYLSPRISNLYNIKFTQMASIDYQGDGDPQVNTNDANACQQQHKIDQQQEQVQSCQQQNIRQAPVIPQNTPEMQQRRVRYPPELTIMPYGKSRKITLSYKSIKLFKICEDDFSMLANEICFLKNIPFTVELKYTEQNTQYHEIIINALIIGNQEQIESLQEKFIEKMKVFLQLLVKIIAQIQLRPNNIDAIKSLALRIPSLLQ